MGFLDSFLGLSSHNNKKFNSELLLDFLTISNSSFSKYPIKRKIEIEIFGHEIFDSNIPAEFQEEEILKEEYFNKRYRLTFCLIGIAIIEALVNKKFGGVLYSNEIYELKKRVYPNLLQLRTEILVDIELHENNYDWRYDDNKKNLKNDSSSFLQFDNFTRNLSFEVKNLLIDNGEVRCLLFHCTSGLGRIISNEGAQYHGDSCRLTVKELIKPVWNNLEEGFQML
jgi:hypothetical protein